jgi:hypothetical protein
MGLTRPALLTSSTGAKREQGVWRASGFPLELGVFPQSGFFSGNNYFSLKFSALRLKCYIPLPTQSLAVYSEPLSVMLSDYPVKAYPNVGKIFCIRLWMDIIFSLGEA